MIVYESARRVVLKYKQRGKVMTFLVFLVSLVAAYVGYCQLRIANAKLRMDLYNKRFAIYTAALDLHQACYQDKYPVLRDAQLAFVKYFRESQFLFEYQDGVYKTLELMKDGAAKISYADKKVAEGKLEDLSEHLWDGKRQGLKEIDAAIRALEVQLTTYLNFSDVDGWNNNNLMMAVQHAKNGYEWLKMKLLR
jgi:hypothetical protein